MIAAANTIAAVKANPASRSPNLEPAASLGPPSLDPWVAAREWKRVVRLERVCMVISVFP
jgi:hypothetical protein